MTDKLPLTALEQAVLDRVIDASGGQRADVEFQTLARPYPQLDLAPTTREIMAAVARLKTDHYLTSVSMYGVGGEGLARLEERRAAAADTAAPEAA